MQRVRTRECRSERSEQELEVVRFVSGYEKSVWWLFFARPMMAKNVPGTQIFENRAPTPILVQIGHWAYRSNRLVE